MNELLNTKVVETKNNIMVPVIMISLALAIRQMSMTIIAPFLSTYCKSLAGYTPLLAGMALGAFGLMQAIFQIPFGMLSDRYGNKKVLISGLIMVVIGFFIAFWAKNIWILIAARFLQGSGAVIGVGYSWAAGISCEENRTRTMSILGAFVSVAAALAFAVGPILRTLMSVNWMFFIGGMLLAVNTIYIIVFLKDAESVQNSSLPKKSEVVNLLKNKEFVAMNLAAFLNNFMMVAVFYGAPIYIDQVIGQKNMWKIFVPAIIVAILFMKYMMHRVQKGYIGSVLMVAFLCSSVSILFYFRPAFSTLLIGTLVYLCGYITIATASATRINEVVENDLRGTGNGIFNSFQYIGSFVGAMVVGAAWGISQPIAWCMTLVCGLIGLLIVRSR